MTKRSVDANANTEIRRSKRPRVQPKRYLNEVLLQRDSPESIAYYEQFHPRMTLRELDATPDDDDCEYLEQQIKDALDERTSVDDVLNIQRQFIAVHDESIVSQDADKLRRQLQAIINAPIDEGGDPSLNGFIELGSDESIQDESDQEYAEYSVESSTETDSDADSEDAFEAECLTDPPQINEMLSVDGSDDSSSDTGRRSSDEGYDISDQGDDVDDDDMDDGDYDDAEALEFITENCDE